MVKNLKNTRVNSSYKNLGKNFTLNNNIPSLSESWKSLFNMPTLSDPLKSGLNIPSLSDSWKSSFNMPTLSDSLKSGLNIPSLSDSWKSEFNISSLFDPFKQVLNSIQEELAKCQKQIISPPLNINFSTTNFLPEKFQFDLIAQRQQQLKKVSKVINSIIENLPTPTIHYINAKIVLVGESGVGKSGLGIRLAEKTFRATKSTHGAQFWQIPVTEKIPTQSENIEIQAELTLWDLAGQPDYHIIHQLFLDDTDIALLLFDCSDPADPFRGVPYWAKVLKKQIPDHALKYLISARCDVSPITVTQREINQTLAKYELDEHFKTCAYTGEGVEDILQKILKSIPWDKLPRTTTPELFQIIRNYLLERKEAGDIFLPISQVQQEVKQRYKEPSQAQLETVVSLLQARGFVYRLQPIPTLTYILLQPELINQYASSIIVAARNHPKGIGAILERDVICANFPITGFTRLEPAEEKTILESTIELLVKSDLCFREMGILVFPSQLNAPPTETDSKHPPIEVTYTFSGAIESIYASLVVRLSNTDYFKRYQLYRYSAEFFRNPDRLGFRMKQVEEGTGELEIYFYPNITDFDRITFTRFITDHLRTKGIDIHERLRLYCPTCDNEVTNREAIEARIKAAKLEIPCQYCDTAIIIPQSIEELYQSNRDYRRLQKELNQTVQKQTQQEIENFKADKEQYTMEQDNRLYLLHLSDIHITNPEQAKRYRTQLETDLKRELKVNSLHYLIISGDIANRSTKEEYDAAFDFVDGLVKRFGLNSSRVVIVPGNHDLNWDISEEAYPFVPKRKLPNPLSEGKYISAGDAGALLQDEEIYRQRFRYFNDHFYRRVYLGQDYPTDYAEQAILHFCEQDNIVFLALNSCWEIDHYYKSRASINPNAIAAACEQLLDDKYNNWLKIAIWHHPISGQEGMKDDFMQQLAVNGFQLCLHGHIHEAIEGFHKYDNKRGLNIIGAGTFGAVAKEQVTGIPLQYNLLCIDPETHKLTVETRKKEKEDGAWKADARWVDVNDPKPRYYLQLKNWDHDFFSLTQRRKDAKEERKEVLPLGTTDKDKEVYISYAWGGESENMTNQIVQAFEGKDITIIRDKTNLGYKGLIKDFMRRIGRGKSVIIVISEKYLKSPNCMFELVEIAKNGDFYARIFPIVLEEANIYDPLTRIKYVQYWEAKIKELEEAMKTVSAANLQGIREDIDLYTEVRQYMAQLTDIIKDMNLLTPQLHNQSEFAEMSALVEQKLIE